MRLPRLKKKKSEDYTSLRQGLTMHNRDLILPESALQESLLPRPTTRHEELGSLTRKRYNRQIPNASPDPRELCRATDEAISEQS